MRAYVTSVYEPTTDLCCWALERNGFKVTLIQGGSKLADKLRLIYEREDEDFLRVDADVIVNQYCMPESVRQDPVIAWWVQYMVFDWYAQAPMYGGVQFITKEAIPTLRAKVAEAMDKERPESHMFRLEEFHHPRRCISEDRLMGVHGYGIRDYEYVKETKKRRGQAGYDWDLVERLNRL